MSRRKDRERFESLRRFYPDYKGFRGHDKESTKRGDTALQAVTCSVCGRKRNVPLGVPLEQGRTYVCLSCREEADNPEDGP